MEQRGFGLEGEYADVAAQSCHCLSGIDVRVRLLVALAALTVTVGARTPALPLAALVLGVSLALFMRVRPRLLLGRLLAPFSIALVVMAGQLFFWRGVPLFTLHLGPWALAATREGLAQGLLVGSRVLGSMALVIVIGFSTPFQHLLAAARWFRAPSAMVEVASLMYRYLFVLHDEAGTMIQAQRVRLGYVGYGRALRSAAAVCGMSFARAYDRATDTHRAMICRGYNGELHGDRLSRPGWREGAQLATGLLLLAAAWYLDFRLRA